MTDQDPTPLTYAKVLAVKPGFQVDNPADLREVRTSTLAEGHNLQYGGAARLTMRLTKETTLTSLTFYRKLDYNVINDADITELNLTSVDLHENQHQVSEELTVSQQRERQWLGGLFLFDEVDRQPTTIRLGGPRLVNFLLGSRGRLTPGIRAGHCGCLRRVSVTGGLRYTRERKTIDNLGRLSTFDVPTLFLPGAYITGRHTRGRRSRIRDSCGETNVGLRVRARGFKSGGFNLTSPEQGVDTRQSGRGAMKAA